MKMAKELQPFYALAVKRHWRVIRLENNHISWVPPQGKVIVTPGTAGREDRSIDNSMGDLRRAGLNPAAKGSGSKRKHPRRARSGQLAATS
jgi:hypothetical protein